MSRVSLTDGWLTLDRLSLGEYDVPLSELLTNAKADLTFKRIERLFGVYLKEPFAEHFPYDITLPSNWAQARRFWEIHAVPSAQTISSHEPQYALLELIAIDWKRPIEFVAEYNVALWLCRRFRPVICGEAKALENTEKIAKDLEKQGTDVSILSLNQALGIAATTIASYLAAGLPLLAGHTPIVTGATLLVLCLGQRKCCTLLTDFEKSYDKAKDRFATHEFYICGATSTSDGRPCRALVRTAGEHCFRHA